MGITRPYFLVTGEGHIDFYTPPDEGFDTSIELGIPARHRKRNPDTGAWEIGWEYKGEAIAFFDAFFPDAGQWEQCWDGSVKFLD